MPMPVRLRLWPLLIIRIMKYRLMIFLSLCTLLASCKKEPIDGVVVDKHEHHRMYMHPALVGKTTVLMPRYNDRYILKVKNDSICRELTVSAKQYSEYQIGDSIHYPL